MPTATDRRIVCRTKRAGRPLIRTVPPGLLVLGGDAGSSGGLTAADLIALARAARRDAADRDDGERAEQG
jgi:hypothetical protein